MDIENTLFMLPENLRNFEHNSTFRNSKHICTLKTKYLPKYVTRKKQNVPATM